MSVRQVRHRARNWEALENYERNLARKKDKELFIIAGPIGQGGVGANGPAKTIAGGKVVVPEKVFKVIWR